MHPRSSAPASSTPQVGPPPPKLLDCLRATGQLLLDGSGLVAHRERVRAWHRQDRARGYGPVGLPDALDHEWRWKFWWPCNLRQN
ncbi:MAG TPA: hypothetical protein VKJ47_09515 [Candidatus Binatia bacterium]|nr:hypothetical protein [Candidatus Binatia bacterium]